MYSTKRKGLIAFLVVLFAAAFISCLAMFAVPGKTVFAADDTGTQTDGEQTENVTTVTDAGSLKNAISSTDAEVNIRLGANIAADVEVPDGKTVTLDLNGFTLTNVSDHTITNRGFLTINDSSAEHTGTVDNISNQRNAIFNLGEATLLGGNYTRSHEAGSDLNNGGGNSWYNIKNLGHLTIGEKGKECNVKIIQTGHFSSLVTNGYYYEDKTEDHAEYFGLVTTKDKIPTLTIYGGEFTGGANSIKNDNHGVITIEDGTFNNSTQSVILNWNYLTINGGSFNISDTATAAVTTSYLNSGYNNGTTTINDGQFNGAILADDGAANVVYSISGGEFKTALNEKFIADNFLFYATENGYSVGTEEEAGEAGAVAAIGKITYESLQAAVDDADNGDTVALIEGANGTQKGGGVMIEAANAKDITIDFKGLTYEMAGPSVGSSGTESQSFHFEKGCNIVLKNGNLFSSDEACRMLIQNYANLTLENIVLDAASSANPECEALSVNCGNVIIKGNTQLLAADYVAFDVYYWPSGGYGEGASVTFDETFSGRVEGVVGYDSDNVGAAEIYDNLSVEINGNGSFDISLAVNSSSAKIVANSGIFTEMLPEEYLGENSVLYTDNEGTYAVASSAPEGMVKVGVFANGKAYTTVADALAATEGEVTVMLYDDLVEDVVIPEGRTVTLDLNGKTLTNAEANPITNNGNLTITGNGIVRAGGEKGLFRAVDNAGGVVLIENGEFISNSVAIYNTNGEATINGGRFVGSNQSLVISMGEMTINGGTFVNELYVNATAVNAITGTLTINDGSFSAVSQAVSASVGVTVNIYGGTFEVSSYAYGTMLNVMGADLTVTGGTFVTPNSDMIVAVNLTNNGTVAISGGTFSLPISMDYLEEGYALSYDSVKDTFTVESGTLFAHVARGLKTYGFVQPNYAIAFADEGETVVFDVSFNISGGALVINKAINIDLNGKTITNSDTTYAVIQINGLESGKTFDVNIYSSAEGAKIASGSSIALWAFDDANVTVDGITLEGALRAAAVGKDGNFTNASLTLNNCLVVTTKKDADGIAVMGNVTNGNEAYYDTLNPVTLVLNNTEIKVKGYAVFGNGLYHNTYIEINDSNLLTDGSGYTGIYHPQNGTLIVNGGSITAENAAIEIRAGDLTIKGDAELTATSTEFETLPNGGDHPDGNTVAGAALAISQHTTDLDINVNIESGTFNGVKAVYENDLQNDSSDNISLSISNGQFNGAVESENEIGYITGGLFKELPAPDAFAAGLTGELFDGYYVTVNAEETGTAATIADRLSAQNDMRVYLAAFGLTLDNIQKLAETDDSAAAVAEAYEDIFMSNTKDDIAKSLAAAMDAVDAFVDALNAARDAAVAELEIYAAAGEGTVEVALPTYILSAINGAEFADEINAYLDSAKAEIDEIRAERKAAEEDTADLERQIKDVANKLAAVESIAGNNSAKLDNLTADMAEANGAIDEIQALLGSAADTSANETIVGMIKETQDKVAAVETNLKAYIDGAVTKLSENVRSMLDALDFADSADVAALESKLTEISGYVDGVEAGIGNLADGETLASVLGGIATAQEDLETAVGEYKTAVEDALADITETLATLKSSVEGLSEDVADNKTALSAEIAKLQTTADKLSEDLSSIGKEDQTDLSAIAQSVTELKTQLSSVAQSVDTLATNNEQAGSSVAGLYIFVAVLVVLVLAVLVVVSFKKRR